MILDGSSGRSWFGLTPQLELRFCLFLWSGWRDRLVMYLQIRYDEEGWSNTRSLLYLYRIIGSDSEYWVRDSRLPSQTFILLTVSPAPHSSPLENQNWPATRTHPPPILCLIHSTWPPGIKNGASDLSKNWERRCGKLLQQAGHSRSCQACCSGDKTQSPSPSETGSANPFSGSRSRSEKRRDGSRRTWSHADTTFRIRQFWSRWCR